MVRAETERAAFSERDFYLREFRDRTMAIAVEAPDVAADLAPVLDTLSSGECRVVLCARHPDALDKLVEGRWLEADAPGLEAEVWRRLHVRPRLGVPLVGARPFLEQVRDLAVRLGVFKLVVLDPEGGLPAASQARSTCVDRDGLSRLLAGGDSELASRLPLLRAVDAMLEQGVPAVNLCAPGGLADELFTYAGSGTLFTRERYVQVRRLGVDDFDAVADLVARGVEEGFLLPRSREEMDRVLAHGFGAFVEGRYLAGIGALLVHREPALGELVALYAITRFLGEGVGAHLVAFAAERARGLELEALVACTVSTRAAAFFERQGFRRVTPAELPPSKWQGYEPARLAQVICLRRELRDPA
jgi:N-acetylglutamate synthase-like GNAT family acetyltransferase